jgi:hypothetical protein
MKQLEKSMETHKIYQETFDVCSIGYSANVNVVFLCLIDVGYAM